MLKGLETLLAESKFPLVSCGLTCKTYVQLEVKCLLSS